MGCVLDCVLDCILVVTACVHIFQMSESDKTVIDLHEISADVMEVLLDFVYTETVNVSVENVQELLPAACLLQLTGIYIYPFKSQTVLVYQPHSVYTRLTL